MATQLYHHLGENRLLMPSAETTARVFGEARRHLREKFVPGVYRNSRDINAVLQHQYEFYSGRVDHLVQRLASREFMEFLLYQYDLTVEIKETESASHSLTNSLAQDLLPNLRRGLKYLAERTTVHSPPEFCALSYSELLNDTEEVLVCASIMTSLYQLSETTYSLFPDQAELTLFPDHHPCEFLLDLTGPYRSVCLEFAARATRDRDNRDSLLSELPIELNLKLQAEILDNAFRASFGATYAEFWLILRQVIHGAMPAPGSYPVQFNHYGTLVKRISEFGFSTETARTVLGGFTLRKDDMEAEGRALWKPKRPYRAYRRAFFEFPHPTGMHLAWSKKMAQECLLWLLTGACFKKLPTEWVTPAVRKAMDNLSNVAGKCFERVVERTFERLGIVGSSYKDMFVLRSTRFIIPSDVGEIDFLGCSSREPVIVLAECKLVEHGMDPRFYRDDVSQFVTEKKSFSRKFGKKIAWAIENRNNLARAFGLQNSDFHLAAVMVTLHPTFAAHFIQDFPCVSLTELILDYLDAGCWPYRSKGFS